MKDNLWNFTKGKTRAVMEYVSNLKPLPSFSRKELFKFEKIKEKASNEITADGMLKTIGYNLNGRDDVYNFVLDKR